MKDRLRTLLRHGSLFYVACFALLLAGGLSPSYLDGRLLLGGEGNFVLDYPTYFRNFYFAWNPTMMGTGLPNLAPMAFGVNIPFLAALQLMTGDVRSASFVLVFLIYFVPFLAMMGLCRQLALKPFAAFLVASFYVVNPFSIYFLNSLNPWNVSALGLLPLTFWVILRFFERPGALFLAYGCCAAVFSFAFTNPPLFLIFHAATLLSLATTMFLCRRSWSWSLFGRRAGVLLAGFISFSLWWLLPLCFTILSAVSLYTEDFAQGWLTTTVRGAYPIWPRLLLLPVLIPRDPTYDFFSLWYHSLAAHLLLAVPMLIVLWSVFFEKVKTEETRTKLFVFTAFLAVMFLAKGNAFPLGFVYKALFNTIPFFNLFKTPVEKFGLLYVYLLTLLLAFAMRSPRSPRAAAWITTGLFLYVLYAGVPVAAGQLIPPYKIGYGRIQRTYKEPVSYACCRREINADAGTWRLLGLPGVGNYQVCLTGADGHRYVGMDPLQMNLNKPVVAAYNDPWLRRLLFENFGCPRYAHLLGLFNIRHLLVNPDQSGWFGYTGGMHTPEEFERSFGPLMPSRRIGRLVLYDNTAAFVPHIYAVGVKTDEADP